MSEPKDNEQSQEMRPIPDGGLAEGMPDWLRRRPAWAEVAPAETTESDDRQPAEEHPETSAVDAIDEKAAPAESPAPPETPVQPIADQAVWNQEPDTSPIDPTALVSVEHLPAWLQRIAKRAEVSRQPASPPQEPATASVSSESQPAVVEPPSLSVPNQTVPINADKESPLTSSRKIDPWIVVGLLVVVIILLLIWQLLD